MSVHLVSSRASSISSLRAPKGRSNLIFKIASSLTLLAMTLCGCQTAPMKPAPKPESSQEVVTAIGSVTEGLTNQKLSEEDLKKLAVQVQKDPQAQSALNAVNQALSVEQTDVKYCPVDGERFSGRIEKCPEHGGALKNVE